ncbi:Major facilitator superfamily (MFS) profile domain-containing protein [Bordetella tumbae]|uniref:MFS transporter n=1 Tax=Bordetella tumbae TaxID=1649139 RepID=UPI0039EED516
MATDIGSSDPRQRRFVVASTFIGATIEWYDFYIFGVLSALFLNKLFFPTFDDTTGTMLGFMAFATAWIARPIGGVVAGHLGDRIGRKKILLWSFIIMGLATMMIGMLPTYDNAGSTGAVLLVLLRIVQGLSVGAEYGGAVVTVVEHAEKSKRGFYGSVPQIGSFLGLLLGNGTFVLMTYLDNDAMMTWGWRVPFLFSALMLVVGVLIRKRMAESPDFEKAKRQGAIERIPFVTVVRKYPRQLISVMLAQGAPNTFFWTCAVAMVSYGVTRLGFTQTQMLAAVCVGAAVEMCTLPLFGKLSDRVGRRKVFVAGLIVLPIASIPLFAVAQTQSYMWLVISYALVLGIGHSASYAAQQALFAEMFPTSVRYSGISIGYQMSGALFAGPLPIIATALIAYQNGSLWLFYGYVVAVAIISILAIMAGKPHYSQVQIKTSLEQEAARERSQTA